MMMERAHRRRLPEAYRQLFDALADGIPTARLIIDPLRLFAYGTDASFYRLTPKMVVMVEHEAEVIAVLRHASRLGTPVTFRAAGTSLSGQAVTDSVLVLLGDGWNGSDILDDGLRIRLQPGVIGAEANRRLAPLGRKIGPDPASINACKIGGIAANNASGMCCGTAQNSYRTVESMRLVLADGTALDTGDPDGRAAFAQRRPDIIHGLEALRNRVREDASLRERIASKFRIKNTTGYSLNAFLDFEDPIDILQHLMIGSEGTLGFLSSITYRTVIEHPHKASALLLFPDAATACAAVPKLGAGPVEAVELIDRAGLASVQDKPGMPAFIRELGRQATALLVETRAGDAEALGAQVATLTDLCAGLGLLHPAAFTDDPAETARLWAVRKGLFPSVGAVRQTGTTVIIEDIAVAVERLADAVTELHDLFAKHGYDEAIIFGHALAGNLHFVFTQGFDDPTEVARYAAFMDDVCHLITDRYDGSLKAEHGTGRNMAPFVEMEWGAQAYALMKAVKELLDPNGLLNPGVIFTDDPQAHLRDLKALPAASPVVDKCIECGFCEPKCPSHLMTLSPRQRITARREIARLEAAGDTAEAATWNTLYTYPGLDTCAACGLCSTACPVGIDTGRLTKDLRGTERGAGARWLGRTAANHYGTALIAARAGLTAARLVESVTGPTLPARAAHGLHQVTGGLTPAWPAPLPGPARPSLTPRSAPEAAQEIVYFPSCATRTFGPAGNDASPPAPDVFLDLCTRAGLRVRLPEKTGALCCGMPFESKGLEDTAADKSAELAAALRSVSNDGALPIVFDTSPCTLRMRRAGAAEGLTILDVTEAADSLLMPRLSLHPVAGPVALHITCSTRRLGQEERLLAVARACCETVIVPADVGCCGFAGDKGFTTPALNAHALRHLKDALPADCGSGVSTSRTCEIGLTHHSRRPYRSILHLLEEASR